MNYSPPGQLTAWQLYNKRPVQLSQYQKWVKSVREGKPVMGVYIRDKWYVVVPEGKGRALVEVPFQKKKPEKVDEH